MQFTSVMPAANQKQTGCSRICSSLEAAPFITPVFDAFVSITIPTMQGKSPHVARMVLMVAAWTKPVPFSMTGDPMICWPISFGEESTTANRFSANSICVLHYLSDKMN